MKQCSVCGSQNIDVATTPFGALVSSDCRPWEPSAEFFQCKKCGGVGKLNTPVWLESIDRLYRTYAPYYQAGGEEQRFRDRKGDFRPRSEVLVDYIDESLKLSRTGAVLDIGCGNGAFLKAFHKRHPSWELHGNDLGDHFRGDIEAISANSLFHSGDIFAVSGKFDVVTLIHCLEHVIDPADFMAKVLRLVKPGGVVFVEVPNVAANPFDLLIYDHRTHFTEESMERVLKTAGARSIGITTKWHPKELSVLAFVEPDVDVSIAREEKLDIAKFDLFSSLSWLEKVAGSAIEASNQPDFGLFGTSITATWLATIVDSGLVFFVDEDPNRVGREHLGRPVLSPDQLESGATVFMPFIPEIATEIRNRLGAKFATVSPPPA